MPERNDVAWDNDLYVIGLPEPSHDFGWHVFRDTLSAAMDMFRIDGAPAIEDPRIGYTPRTHPGLHRLVGYMHGNILLWIPSLVAFGGVRYYRGLIYEGKGWKLSRKGSLDDGLSLDDVPAGVGVHCFVTEQFPMVFVRFCNPVAFTYTTNLIAEYGERTGNVRIAETNVAWFERFVNSILLAVEQVWAVY